MTLACPTDSLRLVTLRALFARELVRLPPPTGPDRRHGAAAHGRALLHAVGEELDEIDEEHRQRLVRMQESAARVTDLALELTAFLYSAGSPHLRWRRWASLAAFGSFLAGEQHSALRYGAIAGEWAFLDRLSIKPPSSRQLVDQVLGCLIGAVSHEDLPEAHDAPGEAWRLLALSIPASEHTMTGQALAVLADEWVEVCPDWQDYSYRTFPSFDPAMCAAAALATRQGYQGEGLSVMQRTVLEPGLVQPWPQALYPTGWRV